jgi:hypothetical protein
MSNTHANAYINSREAALEHALLCLMDWVDDHAVKPAEISEMIGARAAIASKTNNVAPVAPSDDGVQGEWHRENDDRSVLLYTLRQNGWRKGKPVLVNDVTLRIERCPGSSADISHIADAIVAALPTPPSSEVA